MTDKELARKLRDAEQRGDVDDVAEYLNEVCGRLNLPLDETAQGLTPWASQQVDDFLGRHLP